ncbi:lipoyl synthase [Candidatus Micrarchaeota archaeon]|nr:lipoyl synthase [Candidatus Micrarchaeota archaeon]MBU1930177.1 lipoyl synthase [Candidatus Micrarchaeota archaeon]
MLTKPSWLKIRPPTTEQYNWIKQQVKGQQLHTVCQEAHCPNMTECWSAGTASFMILGDTCTRGCRFCAIKTAKKGNPLEAQEPKKLAETIQKMKLKYVVITSVDRDDLSNYGAGQFANCILAIKKLNPKTKVEVLTPDFCGEKKCIETVLNAKPDVFGHNLETVKRLQEKVRDQRANYEQSLKVLRLAKEIVPTVYTKSALMLGMGETKAEILKTMEDLRNAGVELLSLGQYLQPAPDHYPVHRFVNPNEFAELKSEALKKGFLYCQSGPFVRSSFKAGDFFRSNGTVSNSLA